MWKYEGSCVEGEPLEIAGVNVWNARWERVPGESATAKEPGYGQAVTFPVYRLAAPEGMVRFAAGEYSAGIFMFLVEVEDRRS